MAAESALRFWVHVYAATQREADAWARSVGLRPCECRLFGTRSGLGHRGLRYQSGDRVVVVGEISHEWEAIIARSLAKTTWPRPEIERVKP